MQQLVIKIIILGTIIILEKKQWYQFLSLMFLKVDLYIQNKRYMMEAANQQYGILLQDCLSALNRPLRTLTNTINTQREQIQQTFEAPLSKHMSVIQEQTERQGEDDSTDRISKEISRQINGQVAQLIEINNQVAQVVNFYKLEMRQMARDVVQKNKLIKKMSEEREEIKKSRRQKSLNKKSPLPEPSKDKEQVEEIRARQAPSPFPENICHNCSALNQRVQTLEKESKNWKSLSVKIDDCKKKIFNYQAQIKAKDIQLEVLRTKVIDNVQRDRREKEQDDKKRVKKENTTLRGQKVLLSNQLASTKRQLAQKGAVADALEAEVTRLRLEVDNLNSSLTWHSSNLSQLRIGVTKQRNEEWREVGGRMQEIMRVNLALVQSLSQQEESLIEFNQKSKKMQQTWMRQCERKEKKLSQLQSILQDKNQTIIKLKTGIRIDKSDKPDKVEKGGYHADMVRVLNKRLAQRQQRVRVLEDALGRVDML